MSEREFDISSEERVNAVSVHALRLTESEPAPGGDGVAPDTALAALARAAQLVAQADLDALDDRGLLEHVVAFDRLLTRLDAARAGALAAVDRRQAYQQDACVTTASWWRWRTRRDPAQASRMTLTAKRLPWLNATREALERGSIAMAHADAIAQSAVPGRRDAIVAHEPTLVELATRAAPRDVRLACARIAEHVDPDGTDRSWPDQPAGPDPRRSLFTGPTIDGLGDLRGTLDPVTADRFTALLAACDEADPPGTCDDERRSPAQRRHDAFDRVLRAAEEHPDLRTVHGARPHALLTIDLQSVLGRDELATRRPRLGSGMELDLPRALELLTQASVTPVLMLGPWRAVGVGRRHRTLPSWLRPLLTMIHGHCRGPGCDRPIAWSQAAHLTPWAADGATDLDETIPVCAGHHRLMDVTGWQANLDPDTAVSTWTSPDGATTRQTRPPDP